MAIILETSRVELNNFQKNILTDEMFSKGSAVSNIGGIIDFRENISYEEFCIVIKEVIRATSALRLRLNRNNEFYESSETDYEIEKINAGNRETAYELASGLIKKPFSSIL